MEYYWFFVLSGITLLNISGINGKINCTSIKYYKICCDKETLKSVENKNPDSSGSLYLYDKKIYKIKPYAFLNLTIEKLIIKDTEVFMDVEKDSFYGLPKLQEIELRSGSINLSPDIFYEIKNISSLTLSIRQADNMFSRSFKILKSLTTLNIYNSNLEYLSAERFQGMSVLIENFGFRNCKIRFIQPRTFESFSNLHVLALDNNDLDDLDDDIFYGLDTCLCSLSLKSNKLTIIPDNIFNRLSQLQVLDLSNNFIVSVPVKFIFNTWVNELSLADNRLTELKKGIFSTWSGTLRDIRLQNNEISKIGVETFSGFTMRILNLGNNSLRTIDSLTFVGADISDHEGILDISNNQVQNICAGAFQHTKIKKIYFYGNKNVSFNPNYWKLSPSTEVYV